MRNKNKSTSTVRTNFLEDHDVSNSVLDSNFRLCIIKKNRTKYTCAPFPILIAFIDIVFIPGIRL